MIIVTGTIAFDYIMDFPGIFSEHILPENLHKINLSFIVNKFDKRRGGTAGNTSYSLGLLKTPHILFSTAGKDSKEYLNYFKKLKINTDNIYIDKNLYTSTGFAMTDKNDNQIWGYFYGASEKIEDLKIKTVADKDALVFIGPSGARGTMSLVNQCIKNKIEYFFDPGFVLTQISKEELRKGLLNAKYVIGNDYEIALMQKLVKNWKQKNNKQIVIKTLGNKGALIFNKGEEIEIKACKVKNIVDPTGAGDAWRAGFLCGLEKKFDLKTSGQIGAVAASYAVENYGGQDHKYTLKEFKNRYFKNFKHLINL